MLFICYAMSTVVDTRTHFFKEAMNRQKNCIKFNIVIIMIFKTKEDLKQSFLSFYLGDLVLNVVNKILASHY